MVKEVKTSFLIPEEVLFEVKEQALKQRTTQKDLLNRYILEGLAKDKNQTKLELWLLKIHWLKIANSRK